MTEAKAKVFFYKKKELSFQKDLNFGPHFSLPIDKLYFSEHKA
jgi:hypothetical protein